MCRNAFADGRRLPRCAAWGRSTTRSVSHRRAPRAMRVARHSGHGEAMSEKLSRARHSRGLLPLCSFTPHPAPGPLTSPHEACLSGSLEPRFLDRMAIQIFTLVTPTMTIMPTSRPDAQSDAESRADAPACIIEMSSPLHPLHGVVIDNTPDRRAEATPRSRQRIIPLSSPQHPLYDAAAAEVARRYRHPPLRAPRRARRAARAVRRASVHRAAPLAGGDPPPSDPPIAPDARTPKVARGVNQASNDHAGVDPLGRHSLHLAAGSLSVGGSRSGGTMSTLSEPDRDDQDGRPSCEVARERPSALSRIAFGDTLGAPRPLLWARCVTRGAHRGA